MLVARVVVVMVPMTRVVMVMYIFDQLVLRVVMVASYTCIILRLHSRETEAKTRFFYTNKCYVNNLTNKIYWKILENR